MIPGRKVKVVVAGQGGVGKSQLCCAMLQHGPFDEEHTPTQGTVVHPVQHRHFGSCHIALELWDSGGDIRFQPRAQPFYSGALIVMLVYSVLDAASSNTLDGELLTAVCALGERPYTVLIVGLKTDEVEPRCASPQSADPSSRNELLAPNNDATRSLMARRGDAPLSPEALSTLPAAVVTAEDFAQTHGYAHCFTSAKTGAGVQSLLDRTLESRLDESGIQCALVPPVIPLCGGGIRLPLLPPPVRYLDAKTAVNSCR